MQIKIVSAMAGTLGLGALAGWAVTADIFEHRLKDREEFHEMRLELLRRRVQLLGERCDLLEGLVTEVANQSPLEDGVETVDDEITPEGDASEADVADEAPEMTDDEEVEVRSNLQDIIKDYASDPDVSQEFVNTSVQALKNDRTPPFVIDRATYASDPDEGDLYDKITLTYYRRHRVIVDEEEEVIDDVPAVVGWKNLNQFGGVSGDPNVVFIRNRRLNTDYEVVLDEENEPPLNVKYGMPREEFRVARAAGVLKLRPEDEGD